MKRFGCWELGSHLFLILYIGNLVKMNVFILGKIKFPYWCRSLFYELRRAHIIASFTHPDEFLSTVRGGRNKNIRDVMEQNHFFSSYQFISKKTSNLRVTISAFFTAVLLAPIHSTNHSRKCSFRFYVAVTLKSHLSVIEALWPIKQNY